MKRTVAVLLALLLGSAGWASAAQMALAEKSETVSGTLIGFRTIKLSGVAERHLLATIQTDDGQRVVADLGAAKDLAAQNVTLQWNQRLSVVGVRGMLNHRSVLLADKLQDHRVVTIRRPSELSEQGVPVTYGWRSALRTRVVHGVLIGTREVRIKGEAEKHVLAQVRTQHGVVAEVDLGARSKLPPLKLEKGQTIVAAGVLARLGGKPVLLADYAADMMKIERGTAQEAGEAPEAEQQPAGSPHAPVY